jgi:3-oxoadipate enol-lactonase
VTIVHITTEFVGPAPRIAIDRRGAGLPAVFLHGIGGNRLNWTTQLDSVGARHLAVAWDARGYGDSDDAEGPRSFPDFTADLLRVLDHLGTPRAVLCGLSMGGLIATEFHARHPERVAALVLCDTSPGLRKHMSEEEIRGFLDARRKPLLEGRTPAEIAPDLARGLVSPRTPPERVARLVDSLSRLRAESYLKTIEAVTRWDRSYDLGAIRVPTLVIVGEDDRLTPPEVARKLASAIPDARLAVIPAAGHLSNIEAPDAFDAALLPFLDALRP